MPYLVLIASNVLSTDQYNHKVANFYWWSKMDKNSEWNNQLGNQPKWYKRGHTQVRETTINFKNSGV